MHNIGTYFICILLSFFIFVSQREFDMKYLIFNIQNSMYTISFITESLNDNNNMTKTCWNKNISHHNIILYR